MSTADAAQVAAFMRAMQTVSVSMQQAATRANEATAQIAVAFETGQPLAATARPYTPVAPPTLRFRGYSLCHGCSNGRHREHQPVDCMCDLPGCAKEPTP